MDDSPRSRRERVWQVVSQIPAGAVTSYGQVAELAGLPRAARQVGSILRQLPEDSQLPWHRVITSQGHLAFPGNSAAYRRQRQRLEREGVEFQRDRVDMARFRWRP